MTLNTDSSPFQSSPLESTTSPRLFWQNRGFNSENSPYDGRSGSPSPTRRSSIERLQKASRVKNSNILALEQKQEYDPTRIPQIERPLAKVQPNVYAATAVASSLRSESRKLGHQRSESKNSIPILSPSKPVPVPGAAASAAATTTGPRPPTPSKDQASPTKSSLSQRFKNSFDPETGTWSAGSSYDERELPDGKSLHRHAKSVTFDAAPPQINEYEMATPDLSSIGSNSREGSYDSMDDYDDDDHYMMHDGHGHDDSFDASLEDTDKTPVVGPEDWRQDSQEERFEHSPMPDDAHPVGRPEHHRTDSSASNGDHRPLPPLPGMGGGNQLQRSHSTSSNGLSATAERMLGAHRSLPSPPPAATTKSEIQNIGHGKMTLEERLRLMMLSDDGKSDSKSVAEQQRERRMRRAGTRERNDSQTPDREIRSPSSQPEDGEGDDTVGEISGLEEYQLPPRISRESIMRRVNGNNMLDRESDYNFSSPAPSSSPERHHPMLYDPDVPIPSTEDDSTMDFGDDDDAGSVIVTRNREGSDDPYAIPDMYQESDMHDSDREASLDRLDAASESEYSDQEPAKAAPEPEEDQVSTPRAGTPTEEVPVQKQEAIANEPADANRENDFTKGLESFMLSKPQEPETTGEPEKGKMADVQAYLQRPFTPEQKLTRSLTKPEYDGSSWGEPELEEYEEPGTPDSVIHHPMPDTEDEAEEEEEESQLPAIPERVATIKSASGSKLKTRPSATPSDIVAMREARRQVSREVPTVPPIPERHRNRMSQNMEPELTASTTSDDFLDRHPSFKKRSLTLDLDLGLSLDKDFERVIEAQKVNNDHLSFSRLPSNFQSGRVSTTNKAPANLNTNANLPSPKKRGYLMRQNTKLVTASDKDTDDLRGGYRSAGNSPVKATRPQSWTVEPWNGQPRKRSSARKRPPTSGPAPPLPGQESNATATTNDDDMAGELSTGDSGERGRLFVKVMGVKDLDLPLPRSKFPKPEP